MDLVINEWFPEYCRAEEAKENKESVIKFLEKLLKNDDILYVKQPSPFLDKIDRYAKTYQSHRDTYSISIINLFRKRILLDSRRCVFINEECDLPKEVLEKLKKGNFSSDTYLFEAASKTESKLIITTDEKLKGQMKDIAEYKVVLLSDFLNQY